MLIELNYPKLSIRQQCDLLGLNRSSFYDQPAGESELNLTLMRLIDVQYTQTPFYGWPKMTVYLQKSGYPINHKRVQRLMQVMGLQRFILNREPVRRLPGIRFTRICYEA
jgi:putative transposase